MVRLLTGAAALGVATVLLPGIRLTAPTTSGKVVTLLVVAVVFGVLNAVVKPLVTLVTAPLVLLSLGLFLIVINALMLLGTSWVSRTIGLGWSVDGFATAFLGALIVTVVTYLLRPRRSDRRNGRRRG